MTSTEKKVDLLNGLKKELLKKNKFLTYNPFDDSIIINDTLSFSFQQIVNGNYGVDIREISNNINKITSNIFYGWENIKNGRVPKECNVDTLLPCLFSPQDIDTTIFSLAQLMARNTNKRDDDTIKLYKPQVLSNDQYGKTLGVMFLYDLEGTSFPITLKQYDLLTEKIGFEKFMDKLISNSRKNFMKEIETIPKEFNLINNCYLWNLKNMSSRSVIFGAEIFFKYLIEMTGFYADRIYMYPVNETGIALFHGLIDGNDLINQIEIINKNEKSPIGLEVFEINKEFTTAIEFTYDPIGPVSKA